MCLGIRGLVKKVRAYLDSDFVQNDEDIRHLVKNYTEVENIYRSVIESGGMMNYSSEGNDTDVKYSIDDRFEQNYDNWVKNGRDNRAWILVGKTSNALKSIGVKEQNIIWDANKINASLKKHKYLNDGILKQVPNLLEHPVIVMQSKNFDSRITMFGEVYDGDGLPIMAVLELKPTNAKNNLILDEIKIASTHSRKSNNNPSSMTQTQNLINSSDILYIDPDKKRTDNWLVVNRLQLPLHITDYGSINNVSYSNENVKYGLTTAGKMKGTSNVARGSKAVGNNSNIATRNSSADSVSYSNDNVKNKLADEDERKTVISKSDVEAVQSIPRKSVNEFTSEDIAKTENFARKYFKEMGTKSPFFRAWFGDWRENDTTSAKTIRIDTKKATIPRGLFKNKDTGWKINVSSVGIGDTISHSGKEKLSVMALNNIDTIIENSLLFDSEVSNKSGKKGQNTLFMHKMYALTDIGGEKYVTKVSVEEYLAGEDTNKRFYNLKEIKISSALGGLGINNTASTMRISDDTYTVSQLFNLVKKYDKQFNPKPTSKVVNEDGTPKVVYHGTEEFGFTIFDTTKADDKLTLFFTDDKDIASTYSGKEGVSAIENADKVDYGNTPDEIVKGLNEVKSADDELFEQRYSHLDKSGIDKINSDIDKDAYALLDYINNYDFSNEKDNVKNTAEKLKERLDNLDYNTISTPLYMLLHHSTVFNDEKSAQRFAKLEKNIRLINKVEKTGSENVIVGESLDGYSVEIYDIDTAKDMLSKKLKSGIYATYLGIKNPYIVNCGGKAWNDITYKVFSGNSKNLYKNGNTRDVAAYAKKKRVRRCYFSKCGGCRWQKQ